ncbi:peroxisomal membrane protein 11C isoform X2 [Eublepharis macularius]|uniref:Peroxisomal membrane protein 11C isoform X2 n=1 Tax=Eublepharis macularius TaxID=481883 RepID=A0AA97JGP5_EUBMA|nr:peroxisomal membrane protein 11C isoform X2 [Eublepharis macularius]
MAAAAAGGLIGRLVSTLESYRGRDRVIRTLCYGCQLTGGALARRDPAKAPVGRGLLALAAQLSHCRTVLRLFDDLAMLTYSCQYGLGAKENDFTVRWLSILNNLADQLYYPCEHIAWAADAEIIYANPQKWWTLSTAFWGASLLLGIARSLRILAQLERKLQTQSSSSGRTSPKELKAQAKAEVLAILSNMADLANAIHWLPPGVLWAGKLPQWLVGLMGTVSSLIGLYQTYINNNTGAV